MVSKYHYHFLFFFGAKENNQQDIFLLNLQFNKNRFKFRFANIE